MPASQFRVETAHSSFELETSRRLFVPASGQPPDGGWPLVVLLHGMGMTAEQFSLVLNDLLEPNAVYLFPQGIYPYEIRTASADRAAPPRIRIGYAWYLYDGREEPFRTTLARSEAHLLEVIDETAARLPLDRSRIFLLGFSMGAYLAYFMAIRNPARFAGLVAIGGRMKEEFVRDRLPGAARLPVLMLHGEKDRAVLIERARQTYETLRRHGFPVEMKEFPLGHEIRPVEIEAIRAWLQARLRE